MTKPGGASTANGILVQVLRTLLLANSARVQRIGDSDTSPTAAFLVVEPVGGDIQVHDGTGIRVEQIKTRGDNRNWSFRELIEKILPDLTLAAIDQPTCTDFAFVAEGRRENWPNDKQFLDQFTIGGDPSTLDDDVELKFGKQKPRKKAKSKNSQLDFWDPLARSTARGLFDICVAKACEHGDLKNKDPKVVSEAVYRTLAGLRIDLTLDLQRIEGEIRASIGSVIAYREDVETTINALLGELLRRSADGPSTVTTAELFEPYGLAHVSLTNTAALARNAITAAKMFGGRFGYVHEWNVRAALATEIVEHLSEEGVVVLSAASGYGKTWATVSAAIQCPSVRLLPVCVSARGAGQIEDVFDLAAREFVNNVWHLQQDGPIRWPIIIERVAEASNGHLIPILIVDDIFDVNLVRELIGAARAATDSNRPWRLLISCQPQVLQVDVQELWVSERTHRVDVFTDFELQELLEIRGESNWESISVETRSLLKVPILCNAFLCGVEDKNKVRTGSELIDRAVRRDISRSKYRSPTLTEALRKVGEAAVTRDKYPLPAALLAGDESDTALSSGLLVREANALRFAHDRYLSWAVGDWLANRIVNNPNSYSEVKDIVQRLSHIHARHHALFLPTLGLDLVYQLTAVYQAPELAGRLASDLETNWSTRFDGELYAELSSLGHLGQEALLYAIESAASSIYSTRDVAKHLAKATLRTTSTCLRLLQSESPHEILAGLSIAEHAPSREALESVWDLHSKVARDATPWVDEDLRRTEHDVTQASSAALSSCASTDHEWVVRTIESAEEGRPVHALGWVILNIDGDVAKGLWQRSVDQLLVRCRLTPELFAEGFRRFPDIRYAEELERLCRGGGVNARVPRAAAALIAVDLDRAWRMIHESDPFALEMFRNDWLAEFFHADPERFRKEMMALVEKTGLRARRFWGGIDLPMDAQVLMAFVRAANAIELESETMGESLGLLCMDLATIADLLSDGWTNVAFSDLFQRADSVATAMIGRVAVNESSGRTSPELSEPAAFSAMVGGRGTTDAVFRGLESPSNYARLKAIRTSFLVPIDGFHSALRDVSVLSEDVSKLLKSENRDRTEKSNQNALGLTVARDAIVRLALAGDDEGVVAGFASIGSWDNDDGHRAVRFASQRGRLKRLRALMLAKIDEENATWHMPTLATVVGAVDGEGLVSRLWKATDDRRRASLLYAMQSVEIPHSELDGLFGFLDSGDGTVRWHAQQCITMNAAHLDDELKETFARSHFSWAFISNLLPDGNLPPDVRLISQEKLVRRLRGDDIFDSSLEYVLMGVSDVVSLRPLVEGDTCRQLRSIAFDSDNGSGFIPSRAVIIALLSTIDQDLGRRAFWYGLEVDETFRKRISPAFVQLLPFDAVEVLIDAASSLSESLSDDEWSRISGTVDGSDLSMARLMTMLESDDLLEQQVAAELLGREAATDNVRSRLEELTRSTDGRVRKSALSALGRLQIFDLRHRYLRRLEGGDVGGIAFVIARQLARTAVIDGTLVTSKDWVRETIDLLPVEAAWLFEREVFEYTKETSGCRSL